MDHEKMGLLSVAQLATALGKIPVGITIIDPEGRMLYYNEYCSQVVDRKPEYNGKDIRSCHQKPGSIEKIDRILSELVKGQRKTFYYESIRNDCPTRRKRHYLGYDYNRRGCHGCRYCT